MLSHGRSAFGSAKEIRGEITLKERIFRSPHSSTPGVSHTGREEGNGGNVERKGVKEFQVGS